MKITFSRRVTQRRYLQELEAKHGSLAALRRKARGDRTLLPLVDEWKHLASHPEHDSDEMHQAWTVVFHDPEPFFDAISATRLRLYDYLRRHPDVPSVHELAKRLGRNYRNVYQDIHKLEAFGVVELEKVGARTVPHVRAQEVEVSL